MLTTPLTKEAALALFGGDTQRLADELGITRTAIYQWQDGKPIPAKQDLRLRYELLPALFSQRKQVAAG